MTAKTVLITGASSGIGKATAKFFQAKGWNVIATMRTPEKEEELGQLDNVLLTRLDVTDPASVDAAIAAGVEHFGGLDVLVNNAGYGAFGPLEAFSRDAMMRQINTNLVGVLDTTRAALPHMRKQKSGVIINVTSVGGKVTLPCNSLYHATKFGVEGLSESLAFELSSIGVKVKIIEPGAIATDFTGRSFDFQSGEGMTEYQPLMEKMAAAVSAMQSGPGGSPASDCAAVIFEAATDGTDTLRYLAGDNAKDYLAAREGKTDEEYLDTIRAQFGL